MNIEEKAAEIAEIVERMACCCFNGQDTTPVILAALIEAEKAGYERAKAEEEDQ